MEMDEQSDFTWNSALVNAELGFKESPNTLPGSGQPALAHYGTENNNPLVWMSMQVKLNDAEEM